MNKTIQQRVDEFVEYHKNGDGECNNVVLKSWANNHRLSLQERYDLAYFFSITYCVASSIVIFNDKETMLADTARWAEENKDKLIFQSDRKYIRMRDSFLKCLNNYKKEHDVTVFLNKVTEGGIIRLEKAIKHVSSWNLFGRFSAYLFLETFVELTGMNTENTTIEWKKGNTATSGLLNVFAFDEEANVFDKHDKLLLPTQRMDRMLGVLIKEILVRGGNTNVTEIETSLCAYRKFYKGSRYNGYYLDRMLEELNKMKRQYPDICQELFEIRRRHFSSKYLGEVSGWSGVRPEMKKMYINTGMIG